MTNEQPAVAYVVSRWGEPTQTFVRREAGAVAAAGSRIRALSLKRPGNATGSQDDVSWLTPASVLTGLVTAIVKKPRVSLGVLAQVVRRSHPRNVVDQLAAAAIGLASGSRGLVDGYHLHAHFGWVAATTAWSAATFAGRPYSVVLHAFELHDWRRSDRFTPVPLRGAAQVFVISKRDRQLVARRWGIDAKILRMGVPQEWLVHPATGEREDWLIVAVGALLAKKGHAVLLDALARADSRWRLVIIGEGPERAELERRIADLGIGDRVQLAGHQPEQAVRTWLDRATVACLASVETPEGDRDGIPVALMEAMARGTPVVTTDVGAIRELVVESADLVAPGDAIALAKAIDAMQDGPRRQQASQAGRDRIAAEFVAEQAALPVIELVRRADGMGHAAA